ncbi:hypothetical protein AX15_003326 [Amanita polypyramis BW_CC]|nr:hypothetical protein AX15_003326 [Amanita polypyramis BW_CC]
MGKLNIAHHKSYHPYRRDNIERVRRDEEEARLREAKEDGRIMLADSEARIDLLRQRAGVGADSKKKSRRQEDREEQRMLEGRTKLDVTSESAPLPTTNGHINFFQDLEHGELTAAFKVTNKSSSVSTEKGFPLAPSKEDLSPWYSSRKGDASIENDKECGDGKRLRDTTRKSVYDPLTSINQQLSRTPSSSNTRTHNQDRFKHPEPRPSTSRHTSSIPSASKPPPLTSSSDKSTDVQARLSRESSERERALALIRRKKREMVGSETPSTVHGGEDAGYGDMFNKKEVEEARRRRERGPMYWGDEPRTERRDWSSSSSSRRW